jgi:hypothetical protein
VLHLHTLLKLGEAGNPVFERDDLTVYNEGIGLLPMKGCRYLGVLLVQPLPVPRKEA